VMTQFLSFHWPTVVRQGASHRGRGQYTMKVRWVASANAPLNDGAITPGEYEQLKVKALA